MPSYVELDQETLYSTRERLVNYMRTKFDNVDVVPNTVVGDLIVTPQTWTLSAIEQGLDRVLSDLQTENIANNVIYNCNFTTAWLKNFVNGAQLMRPSTGVLRLSFSSDESLVLDRATQFTIAGNIYTIYLTEPGAFYILTPGSTVPAGRNGTVLIDTGSDSYFCDVPIVGETNEGLTDGVPAEAVEVGASAESLIDIPGLESATMITPIGAGYTEYSPRQLAKLAQTTVYAATMTTRNGAIRYITEACPFVESVYPIVNNDRELLRNYRNPYGTASGCMDLYVRSKNFEFTEVQKVRLYYNAETNSYRGPWNYIGQPYYVESFTSDKMPEVAKIPHDIISTNTRGYGALAAYTQYEKLEIEVAEPNDVASGMDFVFGTSIDREGRRYADFTITYQTDPSLNAIARTAESSDNRPINTSLLVRGFIPVIIDGFEVSYVREPGVVPDLSYARDEIKIYLAGVSAPAVYSDGEIAKIMAQAGVKYMRSISVKAHVQWSVANKINDFNGEIQDTLTVPEIHTSDGLRVEYPPASKQLTEQDMYACSVRTIRYYLMEGAVTFNEVKEM